jgi:hypothetical protein
MGTNLRGTLDTTPKPKFLINIEKYLYDELKALGVEESIANESRLQVKYSCIFYSSLLFSRSFVKYFQQ